MHRERHERLKPFSPSPLLLLIAVAGLSVPAGGCRDDAEPVIEPVNRTIADIITADERFEALEVALIAAGMLETLDGTDTYTLFAPNDDAFEDALTVRGMAEKDLYRFPELSARMNYHVTRGAITDTVLASQDRFVSLEGKDITRTFEDGEILINGTRLAAPPVVASNGVIHMIDALMIPPWEEITKKYRSSPGTTIPLGGTLTDVLTLPDIGHVTNIEVVVDIEHNFILDLSVILEHLPTGAEFEYHGRVVAPKHGAGAVTFPLMQNPFSGQDNIQTTFSDSAELDAQDDVVPGFTDLVAYPEKSYRPIEPLAFAYGETLSGEWHLLVESRAFVPFAAGTLNSWGLNVTYSVESREPDLVVVSPREFSTTLGQGFEEEAHLKVRRVAGLASTIVLEVEGGEGIIGEPTVMTNRGPETSVPFRVASDADVGERDLRLVARSAHVKRVVERTVEVVAPDITGIEQLSQVPLAKMGAPGGVGNDIWGWTDPETGKEYVLFGHSEGTGFVDISTAKEPVFLGMLPTHTDSSEWRDIKVYKDHAFIVSEAADHGMQVFDLRDLRDQTAPQTFRETAHYAGFGHAHNLVINEASGFAYGVGSTSGAYPDICAGGLFMMDIATPTSPQFVGCYSGGVPAGQTAGPDFPDNVYTHDAQCVMYAGPDTDYQGRELCFTSDGQVVFDPDFGDTRDWLGIADVTDKGNPVQVARIAYAGAGYSHQGWLTEDHSYFLLNDEFDEFAPGTRTKTYVFDVRDLDDPVLAGVFENPRAAIGHNTFIKGDRAYQANYTSGLRIIDISDIASNNFEELAFFDSHPEDDADDDGGSSVLRASASCAGGPVIRQPPAALAARAEAAKDSGDVGVLHHPDQGQSACGAATFQGAWGNYPFFDSGVIAISDINRGLFLLRPNSD